MKFIDSYTLWRRLPFPPSGSDENLILIHSDLAVADEYITTVIRFVERGVFKPAPVDVLSLLKDVMDRISQLSEGALENNQSAVRFQHAYAALLDQVYRQFLVAAGESLTEGHP